MAYNIVEIDDDSFESTVLKSDLPVLLNVFGTWCRVCEAMYQALNSITEKYENKMKFFRINGNNNPLTAARFGINSVPVLLLFKDGEVIEQSIGMIWEDKIEEMIKKII